MPKFLVIRFSSIGDIVLTSPVVRCLSQQINKAEIHFLTKQVFTPIVTANPHIQKVYGIKANIGEVASALKAERYDFVIDLHNNLRSMRVILALAKPFAQFPKENINKWLLVNFKINKLAKNHVVDRYFKAVLRLNVVNDGKGLDFFIPPTTEIPLSALPPKFQQGYVAVVIGAQHFTKRMPNHLIIAVCKQLARPVVLIGGPDDREDGHYIENELTEYCFNACGKFNLLESASLIKQALAVISNDTGMMHIAAAFQKKIVSVWGSTVPEFGMYPYEPLTPEYVTMVGNNELTCRPCSKIGFAACPQKHFNCMNKLQAQEITGHCVELLKLS